MPNIRIVNWNIEKLSGNKIAIGGMADNIGKVIVNTQADIAIITEVSALNAAAIMTAVSAAANTAAARGNDYKGWLTSYNTGGECYGVLIRDLNLVRPIKVATGPSGEGGVNAGARAALSDLDRNSFQTWPGSFPAAPGVTPSVRNAYVGLARADKPNLPLTDVFSTSAVPGVGRRRFAGGRLMEGGYALGRGFRMPCLAMFEIRNDANNGTYLLSILNCHLGAVRSGSNHLAQGQVKQYKDTHIAQKFQNGGYIDLNGVAVAVQELIVTGDFNLDFLMQVAPAPGPGNHEAYQTLTPTTTSGGSGTAGADPPAAPGAPGAVPVVPFVQPPGGWPDAPVWNTIPKLSLKTANTTSGTILVKFSADVVPVNTGALRGAAFDNLFFGGDQLSARFQTLTPGPPADACEIYDVPAQITRQGTVTRDTLEVAGAYLHQLGQGKKGTKDASDAPGLYLRRSPRAPLTINDRLIGARFISDHLPNLIQINFR
jgi:hypothetical protein